MKKIKQQNAITLVALVITIIVLLILAGISIQAITNTGLFESASQARKETKRAQVTEWLNLKLLEKQMNNPIATTETIIEATRLDSKGNSELVQMGKNVVVDENTSTIEDGLPVDVYFYVQVDEDVYKVEKTGAKFIGEKGKFPPVIIVEKITHTTNSITTKIKTTRNEQGIIDFYIKKEGEEEYSLKYTAEGEEAKGLEYTYTELEQNKNYSIKIVATAANEKITEYTKDVPLGSIPNAEGNITFTYLVDGQPIDKNTWTNKEVTVTASTEITGYTLRTSKDGIVWNNETSQTFTENGKMYVALYDGKNYGNSAIGTVTNIDKLAPQDFTPTATSTTKSITVTASATDADATTASGKSGISEYRFKLDSESWTKYQTSGTYTWDDLTQTTNHTITVEAKDIAGNTKTGTVTKETGTVEQPAIADYSPRGWTNGNVTVTLPTKSGYTTRYTTDGTVPTKTSTQYSAPFTVSSNCTITFVYYDGTNIGSSQTENIINIDKTAPTISTELSSTSKGINSVTLSVGITDANSGLGQVEWYYGTTDNPTTLAGTTEVTELNGSQPGPTTPQTKTYSITGLELVTKYYFKVIAYDVAGKTITSSVISVTTDNPTAADISYTPRDESWGVSNVKSALDSLYSR